MIGLDGGGVGGQNPVPRKQLKDWNLDPSCVVSSKRWRLHKRETPWTWSGQERFPGEDKTQAGPWRRSKLWIDVGKGGESSRGGDGRSIGMKMPTGPGMLASGW